MCKDAKIAYAKLSFRLGRRVARRTLRSYMVEWKGLTFLNNYFRVKTMGKHFERLGSRTARHAVHIAFYNLACTYFFRKKAYKAMKHWRRRKNRSKKLSTLAHILASKRCNRLIQQGWRTWSEIHSTMPKVLLKMVTMKPLKPWKAEMSVDETLDLQLPAPNPTTTRLAGIGAASTTALRSRRYRYSRNNDTNLSQSIDMVSHGDASLGVADVSTTVNTGLSNTTTKKGALDKYRARELTL